MEIVLRAESNVTKPKLTTEALELKNNYYVVTNGEIFNYYPITVEETLDSPTPIIRFLKSPPVLLEGIAILKKRIFSVTIEDLSRKVIRKSREIIRESTHARTITTAAELSANSVSTPLSTEVQLINEPGPSAEAQLEVNQAANATWDEQIGALLHHLSEKEGGGLEWEVEDNS